MSTTAVDSERQWFEQTVSNTAYRPRSSEAVRLELDRQLPFQPGASADGLDELAGQLAQWLEGHRELQAAAALAAAYPAQPLVHFYAYAMQREAGDLDGASKSMSALRALDPGDPMALQLAAGLAGQRVRAVTEDVRLANIAKLASTPLLRNPYRLAVGAIFETICDLEVAQVLDIGVGSGAQLVELIGLLREREHHLRRLELVGLDFVPQFLDEAGQRIAGAATSIGTEIVYRPVNGRIEDLDDRQVHDIAGDAGLDAANATIALHEVPGERKLAALRNLRRVHPKHLLIAEWNYCLENTLAETSLEFLLNARHAAADFVSALSERYNHDEARAVVRDWLSQGGGQLITPPEQRQECFLHVDTWGAILEHSGFSVAPCEPSWLTHAQDSDRTSMEADPSWIATSRYGGWAPIALLHATPR